MFSSNGINWLGFAALLVVALTVCILVVRAIRGSVTQPPSNPSNRTNSSALGSDKKEKSSLIPVVGKMYPFEGTYTADMRIEDIDEDNKKVYGILLVKMDPGDEIKSVQRGQDDEGSFVCVTYATGGNWRTWTWYWDRAEWPEFSVYEVIVEEVEVSPF